VVYGFGSLDRSHGGGEVGRWAVEKMYQGSVEALVMCVMLCRVR
jgi:hypothetical protein